MSRPRSRTERIRRVVGILLERGQLPYGGPRCGLQSRIASHFGVSRQAVSQVVIQERRRRERRAA